MGLGTLALEINDTASVMFDILKERFPNLPDMEIVAIMGYSSARILYAAAPDELAKSYGGHCLSLLHHWRNAARAKDQQDHGAEATTDSRSS